MPPQTSRNLSNCSPHHRFCRGVATPSSHRSSWVRPFQRNATPNRRYFSVLNLHGLNLAIPSAVCSVCRVSGFRCSGVRSLTGRRCQPLGALLFRAALRVLEAARHHLGPIPWPQASRFRPTFQALFCRVPMPHGHDPLKATRARGLPLRSSRGSDGARPAAANNAATGSACLMPNSTTSAPPGASSAGVAAAIAR
jgi:hypothetical protein